MTLPQLAIDHTTRYTLQDSPVGRLLLGWGQTGLTLVVFQGGKKRLAPPTGWEQTPEPFTKVIPRLEEFFHGSRKSFDLPLEPYGTQFQLQVWEALRMIPYGETLSYGQLAAYIGNPMAVRAVGAANGSNPLPIVIPCHRVIGGDGSLTGFGGGLDIKRQLLDLERTGTGWQDPQLSLV